MNWLTDYIRPRIRSIVGDQKEVPDNLWTKCPSCEGMLFHRDLKDNLNVCYHCNHHLRITVKERLGYMFDDGEYEEAQGFLIRAQNAPEKANRPLADKKRREEIAILQAKLDKKA